VTESTAPASAHVFDATTATFEQHVLQASQVQPILIDFWAEWCAPCKALGPLLEKVVASYNGAVRLAKIDVDAEKALAVEFGVRSIPTVVLVRDGQIVDGFAGALPEGQLREFLDRHVQPLDAIPDEAIEEAAIVESPEQTIARVREQIAANPDKADLRLDLAVALMRSGDATSAHAELDALPANLASDDRAQRLRGQLEFADALKDAPATADLVARIEHDPADHAARDLLGVRLLVDGKSDAALEQFMAILQADRHWNEGLAKKRLITAFSIIDDPDLVGTFRRRMSSLLF